MLENTLHESDIAGSLRLHQPVCPCCCNRAAGDPPQTGGSSVFALHPMRDHLHTASENLEQCGIGSPK